MLPLDSVKVMELGNNIAGPYAGSILAMLGADVLKVERPEGGDDARGWGPPFFAGGGPGFPVKNLPPVVMEELGLSSAAMLELNPRLLYCSVGAFGTKGPMRFNAGYEPMV